MCFEYFFIVKFFFCRMTPNHNVLSMNIAEKRCTHNSLWFFFFAVCMCEWTSRVRSSGRGVSDNSSYAVIFLEIVWIHKDIKCVSFCGCCLTSCSNKHFECTVYFFVLAVRSLLFFHFSFNINSSVLFMLKKKLWKWAKMHAM